jgi:hypothetical protein
MERLNIDLIDIINNGGFLKCLPALAQHAFFRHCQIETMKSAILYTAKIGLFDIEIGLDKKEHSGYELINLSEDNHKFSGITIHDTYGIMKTNFNALLPANIIQLLPEHTVNHIDNIEQIEIHFCSGSTIIYQRADLPPAVISNTLKGVIF